MKKYYVLAPLCLFLFSASLLAQSPGGVSTNLTLWIKSTNNVATTGGLVDTWGYVNNANTYTGTGATRPTLTSNVINFNPGVQFTGGTRFMEGPNGLNAPIAAGDDDYTIFAVWKSNTVSSFQRLFTQRSLCAPCDGSDAFTFSSWNDGRYGDEAAVPPNFDYTVQRPYTTGTWNISQLNLLNQATNDYELIDDRNKSTGIQVLNTDPGANGAGLRNLSTTVHRIGAGLDYTFGTQDYNGDLVEMIVFDRPVSGTERDAIFSYLSIKYGINTRTNLTSSASVLLWDAAANSTFNNAVFGIGTDNGSDLNVTQSNSIETGSGNGAGQAAAGNIVLSGASAQGTGDFLIIGHDNGALTEGMTDLPAGASGSLRLAREWKVQHTGTIGTVDLTFDINGLSLGATAPPYRIMIDEDGNGDFTNGTIRYYQASANVAGIVTFDNITLNNNEVFTIITDASATLPVTWVSFTAALVNGQAQLNWQVADNEQAASYEVEFSTDGNSFTKVATIANQVAVKNYQYTYTGTEGGTLYFRIRQIDLDGKAYFSKTVSVRRAAFTVRILNNPVRNGLAEFEIITSKASSGQAQLSSVNGAAAFKQSINVVPGRNRISMPIGQTATGTYILRLQIGDAIITEKVLVL